MSTYGFIPEDPTPAINAALDVVYGSVMPVVAENALDILYLEADASLDNQAYERAYVGSEDTQTAINTTSGNTSGTTGSRSLWEGAIVTPTSSDVTLVSFSKSASCNATEWRLLETGGAVIDSGTFSGNKATLSEPVLLSFGTNYSLEARGTGGASYTGIHWITSTVESNGLSWKGEADGGGPGAQNVRRNIVSAELDKVLSLDFTPSSCYVYLKGTAIGQPVTLSNDADSIEVNPQELTSITFKPTEINKGSNDLTNGGIVVFFWGGT